MYVYRYEQKNMKEYYIFQPEKEKGTSKNFDNPSGSEEEDDDEEEEEEEEDEEVDEHNDGENVIQEEETEIGLQIKECLQRIKIKELQLKNLDEREV